MPAFQLAVQSPRRWSLFYCSRRKNSCHCGLKQRQQVRQHGAVRPGREHNERWESVKSDYTSSKLIICLGFVSRLTLYTFIKLFIRRWRARGTYKERCCPSGGVGPTLKVCEEKGLWWNGPGRTVTSPLRAEGHAGLAWFACEWARSIILVRELSHQIEKVKTSFYQPFPSETEQAINNWVQALGKVKQNDMGLV